MKTRKASWDYDRRVLIPGEEELERTIARCQWALDCLRWLKRGLLSLAEYDRLLAEGPGAK